MPPRSENEGVADKFLAYQERSLAQSDRILALLQGDPPGSENNPGLIAVVTELRWEVRLLKREAEDRRKKEDQREADDRANALAQTRMVRIAVISAALSVVGSIISGVAVASVVMNLPR